MPQRRDRVDLTYRLTFLSPFHCGTGLRAGLVDRVVQRGPDGYVLVPGSTIKGVVRQQCEWILGLLLERPPSAHDQRAALGELGRRPGLITRLFGSYQRSGTLYFDDAELIQEHKNFFIDHRSKLRAQRMLASQVELRARVSLDPRTRTALPGRLFTSEHGIASLAFEGAIRGVVEDLDHQGLLGSATRPFDHSVALTLLVAGLSSVERLGGNRTSGLGRCALEITNLQVDGEQVAPRRLLEQIDELPNYATLAELEDGH